MTNALQPDETRTFATDDGLRLTYDVWRPSGAPVGVPVVLHHGFSASAHTNWVTTGIVPALLSEGRTVVGLDARGHGRSDKPYDPALYGHNRMRADVSLLLDQLGHERVDLVGYSMGGFVAAITAAHPEPRLRSVIIGGIGGRATGSANINREAIAAGLVADESQLITDRTARQFRQYAEMTGADRLALAAIMRSSFEPLTGLDRVSVPTLVLVGENDELATSPELLADAIPGALLQLTPGTHMSAIAEQQYINAITAFLRSCD